MHEVVVMVTWMPQVLNKLIKKINADDRNQGQQTDVKIFGSHQSSVLLLALYRYSLTLISVLEILWS
jgi:hypothetical protein